MTINWDPATDQGTSFADGQACATSEVDGYHVYRSGTQIDELEPLKATSAVVSLNAGINTFTVAAYDKAGNTGASSQALTIIYDNVVPQAPSGLRIENAVTYGGKGPFASGNNIKFLWNAATDLGPAGTTPIGINPTGYSITVKNEANNTVFTKDGLSASAGVSVNVSAWTSGKYSATVKAMDLAGNPSTESTAYVFYLDRSAPPALVLKDIKINDTYATATVLDGKSTIYTGKLQYTLTWSGVTEGSESWQSGVAKYRLRLHRDGTTSDYEVASTGSLQMSQSMTALGDYVYEFWVEDGAGNKSAVRQVTVRVSDPPPVSFSSPMYQNTADGYVFKWNSLDAEHGYTGDGIAYYGALVKTLSASLTTPAREEFDPTPGTEKLFQNLPVNTDLVAYVLAVDVHGLHSIVAKIFRLPPLDVPADQIYTLTEDEYWDGTRTLSGKVVVPAGITLTMLAGAKVNVLGQGGAQILVNGKFVVEGSASSPVVFESGQAEKHSADWRGITIDGGEGSIIGLTVRNAERGLAALSGASVTAQGSFFQGNRVGLHSYGSNPGITGCTFLANEWYGIKEDGVSESGGKRPVVKDSTFTDNGYAYYHETRTTLTADGVNEIDGNSGNN